MIKPYLYVKKIKGKGRGVFTREDIPPRTVVEVSPVLVFSNKDTRHIDKTILHNYIFLWGIRSTRTCLALGYCSLYNHSYDPNCVYEMDFEKEVMRIITRRKIKKGEELLINYNGDVNDHAPMWFPVRKS
ncbi:MAG: SET domain-containing protein [Thermoflavifilum sp.]|nr:SET domain-containing protein [Thermoflavifilum sp.]